MLVFRAVLAAVFAVAAVGKILDLSGSREALMNFGVPRRLASPIGSLLPAAEVPIAVALLVQDTARGGAIAAFALLAMFVVGIARLMRMEKAPDCHCFGQLQSEPVGASTLVRNLLLAAAALTIAVAGAGNSFSDLDSVRTALLLTALSSVGLAIWVSALLRENHELRERPASPDNLMDVGLPIGALAPDIDLRTLEGEQVSLGDRLTAAHAAILVQVNPQCAPCQSLITEIVRWQDSLSEDLSLTLVSAGGLAANREFATLHGASEMLVAEGMEVAIAYQVTSTPSAILIDSDGRVAGPPATGAIAIEGLVRTALRRETRTASR